MCSRCYEAILHPNHWHSLELCTSGGFDGPVEYDVYQSVWQYHREALAAFGREDPFYVYDCEEPECLTDPDLTDVDPGDQWWTAEASSKRWGRND